VLSPKLEIVRRRLVAIVLDLTDLVTKTHYLGSQSFDGVLQLFVARRLRIVRFVHRVDPTDSSPIVVDGGRVVCSPPTLREGSSGHRAFATERRELIDVSLIAHAASGQHV
jgi:hypothetical protein